MGIRGRRGAALALLAAGLCVLSSAIDRWLPCLGWGDATAACWSRQDDSCDAYLGTIHPIAWQTAALLAGYGLLALALLWLGIAADSRARLACAALLAVAPLATLSALAGWSGILTPVLVSAGIVVAPATYVLVGGTGRRQIRPLLFTGAILSTNLLVDLTFWAPAIAGQSSWDTTPGTWVATGLACLVAAATLTWPPGMTWRISTRATATATAEASVARRPGQPAT
ncbi:hypothetical protein [Luteococcus peritonei]|uniref:DUF998 domain-containing protein n=1 Tax=Luteococcus peritonei TaxID=88874 RepID=A0ABW4RRN2_9ACTN